MELSYVLGLLALSLLIYETVIKLWFKLAYYKIQGATLLPGAAIPVLGSIKIYSDYSKALKANDGPLESVFTWDLIQHVAKGSKDFDSSKHKVAIRNLLGYPFLVICDAEMACDVFMAKNKFVTKTGHIQ